MSKIGNQSREGHEHKSFGGIEMIRQATVKLASMDPAPYNVNHVDRKAIFRSQTVDRELALADLPALASRLSLPAGWRYEARMPSTPLRVDTTKTEACVTQDDLANSIRCRSNPRRAGAKCTHTTACPCTDTHTRGSEI
jgi:hypothetical protein